MRYLNFTITNYRAITGPLTIDVRRPELTPIVGINESGKTTVLHALFAFDYANDDQNEGGRHLNESANLYRTTPPPATISAEVQVSRTDIDRALADADKREESVKGDIVRAKKKRGYPETVRITRNLTTKKYTISPADKFGSPATQNVVAEAIISRLPYILFFDDFRDKIDDKIEIVSAKSESSSGWLAILEQLFRSTEKSLSVYALPDLEERQRKTVLSKVQRRLNDTLTREWQNFRLDERDALEVSVDFVTEQHSTGQPRHFIKLDVIERDGNGDHHYFYISDRSKGFYWFFNFVMKLEFNPKIVAGSDSTIYLLDEPGSYLHAFAQRKLCAKLRQLSEKNRVLYCTHSHYLLDPDTIPVSSIRVAQKDGNGSVSLTPISEYRGAAAERRSALQPVLDALEIKPFALDLIGTRATVITEGIYDYLCLELFRGNRSISILPSVGADSIQYFVSLCVAWQLDFRALWDNDQKGRQCFAKATDLFGEAIASRHFRLLPVHSASQSRIIQNLFEGQDLVMIRAELGLAADCAFERTIHSLFYSPRRHEVCGMFSTATRGNFEELFASLELS